MVRPVAIDLFSGAGGLSEGFRQAGVAVAVSVELDRHAAETQRRNHGHRRQHKTDVLNEDVRAVSSQELLAIVRRHHKKTPDVLMGGPPCQGFSRSNMRTRTVTNPLNTLYCDLLRIAHEIRPPVVLVENVADLTSLADGEVEQRIISGLREMGYGVQREVLDAADYGVPQKRKRVFFLATRSRGALQFPPPAVASAEYVTVWDAISDLPSLPNGNTTDEMPYGSSQPKSGYQRRMRRAGKVTVRGNLVSRNSDLVVRRYGHIPQGGNWRDIPDKLMANYTATQYCHEWIYRRLREDLPSVTITNYRKNMLVHPRQDRGLSVREAARLQSFPDGFLFSGSIGFQQQQVANAVPPLLARAIARCIRTHLGH
jgi:DNA (cytosine-5)-methyltransferase 1